MEYILIFISAIFVNNIVLSQFLGICPFLGVSKKVETALGMSAAVAFVLTIATIVTFLIQKYVLDAFDLGYLQTITFILVIAALVQMVEIEKSIPFFISGFRCVLAFDYDELLYSRCSYSRYPERLRFADRCGLRILHCPWLWFGVDTLCGFTRTDELGKHTERHAGNSDSFDYRRFAGYGIYGLLRCS